MNRDPYAPPDQIRRITKRTYKPAQRRALDRLGIPYSEADDGEPLVLLSNLPDCPSRRQREREPRWSEMK